LTITADALDEERAERVLATMRTTEEYVYAGYSDFYRGMFTLLQLRPKPRRSPRPPPPATSHA